MNTEISFQDLAKSFLTLKNFNVLDISFTDGSSKEVYVAASASERQQGLSLSLLDLDGMLFCYDQPSWVPFTMQDMLIDLDIAWYDKNGVLLKKGTFTAGSADPIFCPQAFSYVLEAPAQTLTTTNLKVRT